MPKLTPATIKHFQKTVYDYYKKNKRDLPWRKHITPYSTTVSEIMLQQTQVNRAIEKFNEFMRVFPTWNALATAPVSDVLRVWQGLGYNRRALGLKKTAEIVVSTYKGRLPKEPEILLSLPSIGPATAASIVVYAFDLPSPFIETNIRTVYLHHFFKDKKEITDKELAPLVEATLDRKNPRQWFYALMDYSLYLKKNFKNPSRRSAHYVRQSTFEGSNRQLRGQILRCLLEHPGITTVALAKKIQRTKKEVEPCVIQLLKEGFITKKNQLLYPTE